MNRVNPWLEEKLKKLQSPQRLSLIVECAPQMKEEVKAKIRAISGLDVVRQAFSFIEVTAPVEAIPIIEAVPGVVMVSYNMPKRIMVRRSIIDPLIGQFAIDDIIMPRNRIGPDLLLPFSPLRFLRTTGPLGEVKQIPTAESRRIVRDVDSPLSGKGVTLAVLDTGWSPQTQIVRAKALSACSTDPTPTDYHGHGSWCTSAAAGARGVGMFGTCEGVAPEADLIHIKVLHGLFGFGTEMDIIKGMELAWTNGAKVISMSLGGDECQGGCYEADGGPCPECKAIKMLTDEGVIIVLAAGNSGPDEWTIGCPGCSPSAITVGSVSITDYPYPAYFSSRGPQNIQNKDKMTITNETMKPDILAPGGGRKSQEDMPDEVLYSGEYGYMAAMCSGVIEPLGYGAMHGTSQATPAIAGLCALLVEQGYDNTAIIKRMLAWHGHTKDIDTGWGVARLSWSPLA